MIMHYEQASTQVADVMYAQSDITYVHNNY